MAKLKSKANEGVFVQETVWGGRNLRIEAGKLALQADGAVTVQYGDTVVLATAVGVKKASSGVDFFPLTVHYQEKFFAAGRIPGGYIKREGKPSEYEVLTSRLIDRPIRPLFPDHFYNEVQVICTVLSYDGENDPDIVALIAASAALSISGIPFQGPVAAIRIGLHKNGDFVINPSNALAKTLDLDLVVAGTEEGVLMVESEANELSETQMLDALKFGHDQFQPIIKMISSLKEDCGKEEWKIEDISKVLKKIEKIVEKELKKDLVKAYTIHDKKSRYAAIDLLREKADDLLSKAIEEGISEDEFTKHVDVAFGSVQSDILRQDILKKGKRIGDRNLDSIRPISCEINVLPRVHGSSIFKRGETQTLAIATLGTAQDEQAMDSLSGEYRERFLLHYNFPPYSVGETGRMSSPGRREVGHGKLAWRALHPVMPTKDEFSYTVRVVSEILACNGSSSMATVCGASMAMMNAGVPLKKPVAGIAMGLIKEKKDYAILSDIIGDEDHLGDMDFKVAGTKDGITALQMDIKITSITHDIMKEALSQAKIGRFHILEEMEKAISKHDHVSDRAPKMTTVKIAKEKIRDLIGPGGKTIREICEQTGAKIDIDETGVVTIAAADQDRLDQALARVSDIAVEPEIGKIYSAKVVKIVEFGAFVSFMGAREGLVHISELANERVNKVTDILNLGDSINVKVLGIDERGKVRLSLKAANAA